LPTLQQQLEDQQIGDISPTLQQLVDDQQRQVVVDEPQSSPSSSPLSTSFLGINLMYLIPYIGFVVFAVSSILVPELAIPDSLPLDGIFEREGPSLIEKIAVGSSDVNELFVVIHKLLGFSFYPLACLLMPNASASVKKGVQTTKLPAAPFLFASVLGGFYSSGMYLSTREALPVFSDDNDDGRTIQYSDLDWWTQTVLEDKLVNIVASIVTISTVLNTGFLEAAFSHPLNQITGYFELLTSSPLCLVSTIHIIIITLVLASLIPEDIQRRSNKTLEESNQLALLTCLLPIVGSVLYCTARPDLTGAPRDTISL